MFELLKTTTGCGVDEFCTDVGIKKTLRYVGYAIFFFKIIIPLLLIIFATIDLAKVIGNYDELKPTLLSSLKKIVAGLLIFFVPQIVLFVVDILDSADKLKTCATCLFEPFECNDLENPIKCEKQVKRINILNCVDGKIDIVRYNGKKIKIEYEPSDAYNTKVLFNTSNKKIVTVDKSGYIYAKKIGTAKITAVLTTDESIKASCKINVKKSNYKKKTKNTDESKGGKHSTGNFTYYNQCDSQWQNNSVWGGSVCNTACGAFSLTMVVNNLTNSNIDPNKMMTWLRKNGHGGGAMGVDFFDAANRKSMKLQKHFNVKTKNLNSGGAGYPNSSVLKEMGKRLKKGEILVCLVPYHFITLAGDSSGNVYVLDPGNKNNNKVYKNVDSAYKSIYNYWRAKNGNQWSGGVWAYSKK